MIFWSRNWSCIAKLYIFTKKQDILRFAFAKVMIESWVVFVMVLLWPSQNFAHRCIYNICTDSRSFTRIFNKTRVNYKLFFILTKKLESMSFHIKIWHLVELFLIFWHCFLFVYLQIKKALNKRLFYIYHTVLLIQKARRNLNISLCF